MADLPVLTGSDLDIVWRRIVTLDFQDAQKQLSSLVPGINLGPGWLGVLSKLIAAEAGYSEGEHLSLQGPKLLVIRILIKTVMKLYAVIIKDAQALQEQVPALLEPEIGIAINVFAVVRIKMIKLYLRLPSKMVQYSNQSASTASEILAIINGNSMDSIMDLKNLVKLEMQALSHFVHCNLTCGQHNFLVAVLNLSMLKMDIRKMIDFANAGVNSSLMKTNLSGMLRIYDKLPAKLKPKIGIFFHTEIGPRFSKDNTPSEESFVFNGQHHPAYLAQIFEFISKSGDLENISLIYIVPSNSGFSSGVPLDSDQSTAVTGMRAFPILVSYPEPINTYHLPGIISIFQSLRFARQAPANQENTIVNGWKKFLNLSFLISRPESDADLAAAASEDSYHHMEDKGTLKVGECVRYYDEKLGVTYTLNRIDRYLLISTVHKSERETVPFMDVLVSNLKQTLCPTLH